MKCPICGNEHESLTCSLCGFDNSLNLLQYMTLSPASDDDLKKIVDYKELWLRKAGLEIYVSLYYYKEDGDKLVFDHQDKMLLAKGNDLKEQEVIWCDTRFPRVDGMDILTVCILVKSDDSEKKMHVMIDNPYGNGFWKAGIKLVNETKMAARFVLGTDDGSCYQESDDFYLSL